MPLMSTSHPAVTKHACRTPASAVKTPTGGVSSAALQPRLDVRCPEPEHVRGERVAGKLAGPVPPQHRLR